MTDEQFGRLMADGRIMLADLRKRIRSIDPDLLQYCDDNMKKPSAHGKWERLAVVRFLRYFYKYSFDAAAYSRYIRFAEALPIPSDKGMCRFPLVPFQKFFIANIHGWVNADGTRVIRDALLYVPRKASKTSLISQLACYDLLFGPPDGQIFVASNSFNQAGVCFKIISSCVKAMDPKMRYFRRNRETITNVMEGRQSYVQCLSSSPDRLDGLNASLVILDEYSQAESADLRTVLTSSMGVRDNPLVVTITTASTKLDSPFVTMLNNEKRLLAGEAENDSMFALVFEAEPGDDIGSPDVWRRVQPMLGVSVKERFYEEEYKKSQMSADDLVAFKTKLLNLFTPPVSSVWRKPGRIARQSRDFDPRNLTARPMCVVSIDLSISDDLSAVTYMCYDSVNKSFASYSDYYIPEQTAFSHANRELYKKWIADGDLRVCGEEVIDYSQIAAEIVEMSRHVNIIAVSYDSWKSPELVNMLKAYGMGKTLKPYRQTYGAFTGAVESFEIALAEKRMWLDDSPVTRWMFGNAVIDTDNLGNKKPIKAGANRKIDGVITNLMCLGTFMGIRR